MNHNSQAGDKNKQRNEIDGIQGAFKIVAIETLEIKMVCNSCIEIFFDFEIFKK